MKTIHISDELYENVSARVGNVDAFMERAAKKALAEAPTNETPRFDAEKMKERFRRFHKNFEGYTFEDLKADIEFGRE